MCSDNYFELGLPGYLQHDIDQFNKGLQTNDTLLDCMWCELYGSINSAFIDGEITEEQAWFLRSKYLGLEKE